MKIFRVVDILERAVLCFAVRHVKIYARFRADDEAPIFAYVGENKLAYQTDICRAWQTINRIRTIATTDHEIKQAFIDRVNAIMNER